MLALGLANAIMTIAQVNISSVYLPISVTFDEKITGLGILTSLFFVGYGVLELPGGIYGGRLGPKKVSVMGFVALTLTVFASAFSPTFPVLVALRFIAGLSFGFCVPSLLVLTARSAGQGASGLGVALASASSSLGAGLGVVGWSVLGAVYGWRGSLLIDGVLTAGEVAVLILLVPRDELSPQFRLPFSEIRRVLANRKIVIVSLALFGNGATGVLYGNFLVYYLEQDFGLQPGLAGLITGLGFFSTIGASVVVGRFYDRGGNARLLIFGGTATLGLGTAMFGIHAIPVVIAGVLICCLSGGPVGTVAFAAAKESAPSPELETVVLSIVDNFALAGVFIGAFYFPFLVLGLGYPIAWAVGGAVGVILTAPILLVKDL